MKTNLQKILSFLISITIVFSGTILSASAETFTKNPDEPSTSESTEEEENETSEEAPEKEQVTEPEIEAIDFKKGACDYLGLNETAHVYIIDQNKKIVKDGLTYSSSNKSIVTVDSKGNVTGRKLGTAKITAKTKNGRKAVCTFTVKNAPKSISLNITSAKTGIGEKSIDLNSSAKGGYSRLRKYTSSDAKTASVNADGVVTGIKEGTAVITCTTYNNKKAECKITVGKKPSEIKITNQNNIIQKGSDNHKVSFKLSKNAYSYKITYSVENKSIASVSSSGYITGKKCGKTTITVKTYNGLTASQEITVKDDSLSLNVNSAQLALDSKNVKKIKYGKSSQGRNLEAFVISNSPADYSFNQECTVKTDGFVNVRSGPGTKYNIISSLKSGAKVTRIEKGTKKANGYTWDKIVMSSKKTGYIASNYLKQTKNNTEKTLLIDFAIHGFEDEYYRDGQVLVNEANALIDYFANHTSELKNYRLVIIPCVNPDGAIAGKNNLRACPNAFGRCTAKHIDINRDFISFKAVETRKLRDFITDIKPDFYLNMHGWLDETIGDKNLNTIINKQLGLSKRIDNYPVQSGYAIDWVHKKLHIPATLVEYKSSKSVSLSKDINMIKAIIKSNGKAPTASAQKFSSPVNWKNGSTPETIYKKNNFSEKLDTIKAKASAKCYGKSGKAYVIVYTFGKDKKHKAGFVKYSGGVKKAPGKSKTYKNSSSVQKVYADTSKKKVIGSLDPNEKCTCLGKTDGMYLILYKVSGSNTYKCGFVS